MRAQMCQIISVRGVKMFLLNQSQSLSIYSKNSTAFWRSKQYTDWVFTKWNVSPKWKLQTVWKGMTAFLLGLTNTSSHRRCSIKKMFLKISQNSLENACTRVTFLIKLQAPPVFFCEFCEIFKNNFFTEHLWTTASELRWCWRCIQNPVKHLR